MVFLRTTFTFFIADYCSDSASAKFSERTEKEIMKHSIQPSVIERTEKYFPINRGRDEVKGVNTPPPRDDLFELKSWFLIRNGRKKQQTWNSGKSTSVHMELLKFQ